MRAASWLLTIVTPIILVLFNVRLAMTPQWLQVEYTRPGFPADPFNLTTDERLTYGPKAIDYLIYLQDISALGELRFPNDRPLFNERELTHMRDVQVITGWAFIVGAVATVTFVVITAWLVRTQQARLIRRAVRRGAFVTILLLFSIIVLAIVGWDFFFTTFHRLFFADGTWYFLTSDTLIRLFPEQFWFDTALLIGILTLIEASLVLILTRRRVEP